VWTCKFGDAPRSQPPRLMAAGAHPAGVRTRGRDLRGGPAESERVLVRCARASCCRADDDLLSLSAAPVMRRDPCSRVQTDNYFSGDLHQLLLVGGSQEGLISSAPRSQPHPQLAITQVRAQAAVTGGGECARGDVDPTAAAVVACGPCAAARASGRQANRSQAYRDRLVLWGSSKGTPTNPVVALHETSEILSHLFFQKKNPSVS
jgi:hypothetical protein